MQKTVHFAMAHTGHLRNFESVLRELLSRGHRLVLAFDRIDPGASTAPLLASLEREGAEVEALPERSRSATVGIALRFVLDYGRYLDPPLAERQARLFRARAGTRVPLPLRRALQRPGLRSRLLSAVRAAERRQAAPGGIGPLLDRLRPDVLVVTPLVELGSPQTEHLRAARLRRIPSVFVAPSWDSLTVKGGIHELPDSMLVWNERQRAEAIELHGVPGERVSVTGAFPYDHLFELQPLDREEVCARAGLDASRPYVLYLASSSFITGGESEFAAEWAKAVADSLDVQILVRPHPASPVDDVPGGVVHPPGGRDPVEADDRREYMGSLAHAAAVVGINTSGMIEASILGTPVLSVLEPRFRETQQEAIHFGYLAGMLETARSLPEHVRQLESGVRDPDRFRERNAAFVSSFVRPQGPERSSAALVVDALEAAAAAPASEQARASSSALAPLVRGCVSVLVTARGVRVRPRRERSEPARRPPGRRAWRRVRGRGNRGAARTRKA